MSSSSNLIAQTSSGCTPGTGINLGNCLTLSNGQPVSSVYKDPSVLVNLIVSNIFIVAGIVIFVLIIYSGFKFLSNDSKGKDEAKSIMTGSIVGLIVMFSAYWIIQIIQKITGAAIPI